MLRELFLNKKTRKQPKFSSTNKLRYIYIIDHYSAIKRNKQIDKQIEI